MKIDSSLPPLDMVNVPQRRIVEQEQHRELIQAAKAVLASDFNERGRELTFAFHQHAGRMVIRILDRKTQEVVTQIPAEDLLRMAEQLKLSAARSV
jgi:uncharacterized FlaG/YvyC family protein